MTRNVVPTERSLLHGLVIARWAAWLWMAGLVALASRSDVDGPDHLDHPAAALGVLALVGGVNVIFTLSARSDASQLLDPRFAALELCLAFGLYVADGWVFANGHVFDSSLALASSWPLIAVLSTAIVHGPIVGAVAGAMVPTGRIVGAVVNGATIGTGARAMSFLSSIVFYSVASVVLGVIARRLRDVETEIAHRRARDDVARQLHDGVLQTLALVTRRAAISDPALADLARSSDRELRSWLAASTARDDEPADLAAVVRRTTDRVAAMFGLDVSVAVVGGDMRVDHAVVEAISGAIGEAVTNVGKHAGVTSAVVFVEVDDAGIVFASVRDEGIGFETATATSGDGITRSIRGRIDDIGGRATIISAPTAGTEVQLWSR